MKWDYKVEGVFRGPSEGGGPRNWIGASNLQEKLDALAADGWELVATHAAVPGEANEGIFLICKRPRPE